MRLEAKTSPSLAEEAGKSLANIRHVWQKLWSTSRCLNTPHIHEAFNPIPYAASRLCGSGKQAINLLPSQYELLCLTMQSRLPSPTATEYSLLKSEKSVGSHSQQTWPACSQDVGFTSLNTRDIRLVVREVGDRVLTAEGVPAADVLQTFRPTVLGGLMPEQQFLQQPCLDCRTVRRIREQLLLLQAAHGISTM